MSRKTFFCEKHSKSITATHSNADKTCIIEILDGRKGLGSKSRGSKVEKFAWKNEYSVGVDHLDHQHQHLFEIINKLADHSAETPNSEFVTQVLKEMCDYAHEHFKDEEQLMRQYDYPEIEPQLKQHAYFLKTTKDLCAHPTEQKEVSVNEIAEFLNIWWVMHILRFDMKYKEFFREKIAAPVS